MITLIVAIVFLAVLIVGHEFGHFITAKLFKVKVEEFGFGFPPVLFKKKIGETAYSFNAVPFGGFVKIYGENPTEETAEPERSFRFLPSWKKSLVIVAGAAMNFLIGWLAVSTVFMIGVPKAVFIGEVASASPAAIAGLKEGDQLKDFNDVSGFISFIQDNRGQEVTLNVVRGTEAMIFKVLPRTNPPADEGPLGVALIDGGIPSQGLLSSFYEGFKTTLHILGLIFTSFFHIITSLFTGHWEAASGVTGPVGVFNFLDAASKLGAVYLLQILGLVSLNLTAVNIVPFPALDGGKLFFILYEKLSGGRLNYKLEAITHTVGFAVLVILMVMVTIKDIMNLI